MTTKKHLGGIASVALAALLVAACGSDDAGGVTDAAAVQATTWTLEELGGEPIPDGVEVTLRYDGERIDGSGGCNQYGGEATFDDGVVEISSALMSTLMACEDPAASVEFSFLETLPTVTEFVVEDDRLLLSAGDESLLVFTASN